MIRSEDGRSDRLADLTAGLNVVASDHACATGSPTTAATDRGLARGPADAPAAPWATISEVPGGFRPGRWFPDVTWRPEDLLTRKRLHRNGVHDHCDRHCLLAPPPHELVPVLYDDL